METIIIIAILIALILVALKMGLSKKEIDAPVERPNEIIHMSGIYSIIRTNPREDLAKVRPNDWEIKRHLVGVSNDINDEPVDEPMREKLRAHFKEQTDANLQEIDDGDKKGAEFYYYDCDEPCPVCREFINKGNFVTREEIFKYPQLIPPLHLGCTMKLVAMNDPGGKMRDTVANGMAPFFTSEDVPQLPDWTNVVVVNY